MLTRYGPQESQVYFHSDDSNLRQHIWLELIKDYDGGINYHLGKANIVVDALSHEKYSSATFARKMRLELCREIRYLNLAMVNETTMVVEVDHMLEA
jgi:hypothetical protein